MKFICDSNYIRGSVSFSPLEFWSRPAADIMEAPVFYLVNRAVGNEPIITEYDSLNSAMDEREFIEEYVRDSVNAMVSWCRENYNNGADTMVECWERKDYVDLLARHGGIFLDAMITLGHVAAVYRDQQADARQYSEEF